MKVWEARKDEWLYRIEEDLPGIGFYLRGYKSGVDTFDYLQDTQEICVNFASELFDVSKDSWRLIQE